MPAPKKLRYIADSTGPVDAKVRVGKAYDQDKAKPTLLELLHGIHDEIRGQNDFFRRVGIRNERYFHDLPFDEESMGNVDGHDSTYDFTRVSRNYLRNMVNTWSSRIMEDRPIIKAYPQHANGKDVLAAQMADRLLQQVHWDQGLDDKLWEAAKYLQLHGKVGFRVCWDKSAGRSLRAPKIDPDTMEPVLDEEGLPEEEDLGPEGDIAIDVVTIFDYDYFGSLDGHDADGVVFREYITTSQARNALFQEHGRYLDVHEEKFTSSLGLEASGVLMEEWYIRPGGIVKDGLYALIIGGHVAYASSYPYNHGQLPLCEWKLDPVRGTNQCTTHVSDALHTQRLINELERAKVETVIKTGVPRLVGISEIVDNLEAGVHTIAVDDIQEAQQGARYLEPPDPAELVFGQQQENIQAMFDIFGLNEVLVGKDSVKSGTSAKQIAYLSRLDSMKLSGAVRKLEVAYRRMMRQVLFLARQYIRNDRLLRVAGEGPEAQMQAMVFTGADLHGADIHLEPNSGMDKFRATASEEAKEDLQMGAANPEEVDERAQTGLHETVGEASERQRAMQMVLQAAQTGQAQMDPSINPMVAIKVIDMAVSAQPQAAPILQQLAMQYRQLMAQQQAKMQGGGPQTTPGRKLPASMQPRQQDPLTAKDRPS